MANWVRTCGTMCWLPQAAGRMRLPVTGVRASQRGNKVLGGPRDGPQHITNKHCCGAGVRGQGAAEVVQALLKHGAAADVPASAAGATPLHTAAACGNAAAIRTIAALAEGVDPNVTLDSAASDLTPLHLAAASCSDDAVSALLAMGAEVHANDAYGVQPIHVAALMGNVAALKALLAAGADASAQTQQGETPLHSACRHQMPHVMHGAACTLSTLAWLGRVEVTPQMLDALAHSLPHMQHGSAQQQTPAEQPVSVLQQAEQVQKARGVSAARTWQDNVASVASQSPTKRAASPRPVLAPPADTSDASISQPGCFAVRPPSYHCPARSRLPTLMAGVHCI